MRARVVQSMPRSESQPAPDCTVQVKVSRDYLATHMNDLFHPHLQCCGWFTPSRSKIQKSRSDFWILGLHSYGNQRLSLLILRHNRWDIIEHILT